MIYLINYIIETLLLNWIYFCVSAGIAMFLASVAETVYSYLQVSFRLVQRWVMPVIIARIKKVVDKTLIPNPWTTHMQGCSSHICTYARVYKCSWNSGKIYIKYMFYFLKKHFLSLNQDDWYIFCAILSFGVHVLVFPLSFYSDSIILWSHWPFFPRNTVPYWWH